VFKQTLSVFLLSVVALWISFTHAMTYEEFEFKLSEAQRLKQQASTELEKLTSELEEMKKLGTSAEVRKAYTLELFEVLQYVDDLNVRIKELTALFPELKITPLLKLTQVLPGNAPGQSFFKEQPGLGDPGYLVSVRLKSFPTEIIAGRTFTISGDYIWRQRFRDKATCFDQNAGSASSRAVLNFGVFPMRGDSQNYQLQATGNPTVGFSLEGKQPMSRYCSDAPVDLDPDSGKRLQAGYEKDSRITFSSRFIPIKSERNEEGFYRYTYEIKTTTNSNIKNINKTGVLIYETALTAGRGTCLDTTGFNCRRLLFSVGGSGSSAAVSTALVYTQISDGQQFVSRAPTYRHPEALGLPPTIGTIKLATTVPHVIGYTREQAEAALASAQLRANFSPALPPPSPNDAGKVKATTPKAGTRLAFSNTVVLTMYSDAIKVPNLIGLSSLDAKRALARVGLEHKIEIGNQAPSAEQQAKVTHQNPSAGTAVGNGQLVSLRVWGKYVAPTPQLTPNQSCNRDWPGSISSGKRHANGGWTCICPTGMQWNQGRTACEKIPQLTPNQSCNRDWPGSISSGKRHANGGWICICPTSMQWNQGRTACEEIPRLTPEQACQRDWPGSIPLEQNSQGVWTCSCPSGMQWNTGRTACINAQRPQSTPSPAQPPTQRREQGCSHPWQKEEPFIGETTICGCRYGRAINSQACLPPRPPGHRGCPPGTREEHSRPDGLGLGCECIYGVDKGNCKVR